MRLHIQRVMWLRIFEIKKQAQKTDHQWRSPFSALFQKFLQMHWRRCTTCKIMQRHRTQMTTPTLIAASDRVTERFVTSHLIRFWPISLHHHGHSLHNHNQPLANACHVLRGLDTLKGLVKNKRPLTHPLATCTPNTRIDAMRKLILDIAPREAIDLAHTRY